MIREFEGTWFAPVDLFSHCVHGLAAVAWRGNNGRSECVLQESSALPDEPVWSV